MTDTNSSGEKAIYAVRIKNAPADVGPINPKNVFDLREDHIFPTDYIGGSHFEVPEYAFKPDQWTRALLRGVSKFDGFKEKNVLEIGVGTGPNAAYILENKSPKAVYGSDLDERCTAIALRNINNNVSHGKREKFKALWGNFDLASWLRPGIIDVAYGCLPQVVKLPDMDLHEGDNLAHYYDPTQYPSELHHIGLGLNDFALRQLHPLLPTGGSVILNLSGRPGLEQGLEEMLFRKNGYEPHLLHEEVIPQHSGTSLETLAQVEKSNGHQFEFFTDESGTAHTQINATEAEIRRRAGKPVFHKIYVIEGKKV